MSPTVNSERPIRFAGSALGAKRHICAFFSSPEQENPFYVPPEEFIRELRENGRHT
jgi:hypothetical protein